MKKENWLWMGFLIPWIMVGIVSCSSIHLLPKTKVAHIQSDPSQLKGVIPPTQKEAEISDPMRETLKAGRSTEPQITAQRLEETGQVPKLVPTPTPAPAPTQPVAPTPPKTPTPPGPASPPARPAPTPKAPGVVFNFDNADIYEVVRVMAEIMKINYIIDPRVRGVVNIHTAGQISAEEVFPIFQSILKLNGATAVKKENLYEIVPLMDAKKLFIPPLTPGEAGKLDRKSVV